ncbi:unnamed protein product [Pedinophyceae sp. YPF-701]|nr:unnamed protein product [Pedinophyceae sp. YPF-701]
MRGASRPLRAAAQALRAHLVPFRAQSSAARPSTARSAGSFKNAASSLGFGPARRTVAGASAETQQATTGAVPLPPKLSGKEIRERFLSFYEARGHKRAPSSSLVPEDPTVLLTIAGMLQFKPVFLGQRERPAPCATSTQKCVRTNDIENVGVTARHHTFFEMLGNFSFGDYFKKEACAMAWELATKELGIPAERIFVSVFEEDDEALAIWADEVGVPRERIVKMGEKDNFWASGPTGPCGPCSELYYDFHPERGTDGEVDLDDDSRFIEFYNLVFMEFNRDAEGKLEPLKNKNIDTGMGLERVAQILQRVPNNYETDLMYPIIKEAAGLVGGEFSYEGADERTKTALKVVADHTRAVTYLVSDGVNPSNIGRGYVVRRLIRRTVVKGRLLGLKHPFLPTLAKVAIKMSGDCDPDVKDNEARILTELGREEERFVGTLEKGEKLLSDLLSKAGEGGTLKGADAFTLYDTYGFPLEVTQEMCQEQGFDVDVAGFETEMEAQRQRAKDARADVDLTQGAALNAVRDRAGATAFTGYHHLHGTGTIVSLVCGGEEVSDVGPGDKVDVVLDTTPFYGESGGQRGDVGVLRTPDGCVIEVKDVTKAAGGDLFVHHGVVVGEEGGDGDGAGGVRAKVGDSVDAMVDARQRARAKANHTATHLLQSALKQVLGDDTAQQGSLVEFDRMRFDFNAPKPLTQKQLRKVEALVNEWSSEGHVLETATMPLDEAKKAGAVAMFGEKYDDVVRVVDVPGVSMELCGGTHVASTSEIRGFKILSETGIASGIRRIEAVTGDALIDYLVGVDSVVRDMTGQLKVKAEELPGRMQAMASEIKAAGKEIADLRAQLAVAKSEALLGAAKEVSGGEFKVVVAQLDGVDGGALQTAAAGLQEKLGDGGAVVLGSVAAGGKVGLVAAFGSAVVGRGVKAGAFIGGVAKACGGGGGGRPNLAQAGGKDAAAVPGALEDAEKALIAELEKGDS